MHAYNNTHGRDPEGKTVRLNLPEVLGFRMISTGFPYIYIYMTLRALGY